MIDCACNSRLQLRQARLDIDVTHSNPYSTVGPRRHDVGRDGTRSGNIAGRKRATRWNHIVSLKTVHSCREFIPGP